MSESQEHLADPPRLSQEGGSMATLAQMKQQGLSAQRLAAVGEGLAKHLASQAGTGAAAGNAVGSSSAVTSSAGLGALAKLGLVGLSLLALTGLWFALKHDEAAPAVDEAALAVKVEFDAGMQEREPAIEPVVEPVIEPVVEPVVEPVAIEATTEPSPEPSPEPSLEAKVEAKRPVKQEVDPGHGKIEVPTSETAPASSQLAEELRLLKEARSLAHEGKHQEALQRLAELQDRFPQTPLQAELDMQRALSLQGAGQLDKAARAVRELLRDPRHQGRAAELHHMLLDILLRKSDCQSAEIELRAAIEAGLGSERRSLAERGIEQCKALASEADKK